MKPLAALFLIALCVLSLACNKKSDSAPAAVVVPFTMLNGTCINSANGQAAPMSSCGANAASPYFLNNGACYMSNTGQPVTVTYCSGVNGSTGYYLSNGACYSSTNNTPVAMNYCSTTGYTMSNGSCYSSTGQIVSPTYCTSGVGGGGGVCVGSYIWQSQYGSQFVTCSGADCRGYTLIEYATGRSVVCQ